MDLFDVIVIGSGPGGYVCAIRMAQLGYKTAIIERYPTLGGTCLNVGCIPSKALLDSSEHYHKASHEFETHGIDIKGLDVNFAQMIKRKGEVVQSNVDGVEYLMKKNKISVYHGHAKFTNNKALTVQHDNGKTTELTGQYIVIATGSKPAIPPAFNYDKKRVITSTEALILDEIPKKLVIIGGGVIGLELGSVYGRLGSEVTVFEYADRILGAMDKDVSREMTKILKKINFSFHTKHSVDKVTPSDNGVVVEATPREGGEPIQVEADYCLVSVGRRPYTDNLGLEQTDISTDERGFISVNNHLQTSVEGVYAIGDVIGGAMLAHKAEDEGVFVAELISGQRPHIDYHLIPNVVYTWPEVATVGLTEEELKSSGQAYNKGKFNIRALGRARASMDLDGFVKVLADKETDEVLGVQIVGPRAADMIQEATAVMEFKGAAEDIARICHPHPTYTEAIKEAALDVDGRALHA